MIFSGQGYCTSFPSTIQIGHGSTKWCPSDSPKCQTNSFLLPLFNPATSQWSGSIITVRMMTPLLTHWSLDTRTLKCHSSCSLKFHRIFCVVPWWTYSLFFGIRIHKPAEIRVLGMGKTSSSHGKQWESLGSDRKQGHSCFHLLVFGPILSSY